MYLTRLICGMFLILGLLTGCISGDGGDDAGKSERERAIAAAMQAYEEVAASGMDLSNSPCIAEELEDVLC